MYAVKERREKPEPEYDYQKEFEYIANEIYKKLPNYPIRQIQYDERKEPLEQEGRSRLEGISDPPEDRTDFEISLTNKDNKAVIMYCISQDQRLVIENIKYSKNSSFDTNPNNDFPTERKEKFGN